jgi:hypothetical protein
MRSLATGSATRSHHIAGHEDPAKGLRCGKEGVDGSSPSEGSAKDLQTGFFISDRLAANPKAHRT